MKNVIEKSKNYNIRSSLAICSSTLSLMIAPTFSAGFMSGLLPVQIELPLKLHGPHPPKDVVFHWLSCRVPYREE
jgi:hypothetical protein